MPSDITSSLQEKLADRWAAALFGPALVFWLFGLGAWTYAHGLQALQQEFARFTQLPGPEQIILTALALFGLVASSVVVEKLDFFVLRVMEGYWLPIFAPISCGLAWIQSWRWERADDNWSRLANIPEQSRTPSQQRQFLRLDDQLHRVPDEQATIMPTTVGNTLRASEQRPRDKYGLDVGVCWPRLWLLLPNEVRDTLSEARKALDSSAQLFLWSLLLSVWFPWAGWVAILAALIGAIAAYLWAIRAAATYGDLLESAFDLYRFRLYKILRWPAPTSPATEKTSGEALAEYLFRGTGDYANPDRLDTTPKTNSTVTAEGPSADSADSYTSPMHDTESKVT